MATSSVRYLLPAHTTRNAAYEESPNATIQSQAPEAAAHPWNASLYVDQRVPRPTPLLDVLRIDVPLDALRDALRTADTLHADVLPHPHGLVVLQRSAARLYCADIRLHTEDNGALRFSVTPRISLVGAPSASPFDETQLPLALSKVLPISTSEHPDHWRLDLATLFAHYIDAGWNLPLPRGPGAFISTPHQPLADDDSHGIPREPWSTNDTPSSQDALEDAGEPTSWRLVWATDVDNAEPPPLNTPLSPRAARALDEYAAGLPAAASLLSATSLGGDEGAHIAASLASLAAAQRDTHTLQILRITQQRLFDRGQRRLSALSALFSAHAMLDAPDDAASMIPILATQLGRDCSWTPATEWFETHCREWFEALREDSAQSTDNTTADAARPTASRRFRPTRPRSDASEKNAQDGASLTQAYASFQDDKDDAAWRQTIAALQADQRITDDDTASMVLRLIAQHPDHTYSTTALEAVVRDVSSELHYVRAVQLLADRYDALGALERSDALLRDALKRFPDSVLLRVSLAQFLSRSGHPEAADAWTHVLAHEALEPWEVRQYTQERSAALRWQEQAQASARLLNVNAPDTRAPTFELTHAPRDTTTQQALNALEILLPPAADAPSTLAEELSHIDAALTARPSSDVRAKMLARRALVLLRMNDIARAAQSWTGALILMPQDARVRAGVAVTRDLQDSAQGNDDARTQFLDAAAKYRPDNAHNAEAMQQLIALLR